MRIELEINDVDCKFFSSALLKRQIGENELKSATEECVFDMVLKTIANIKMKMFEAELQNEINEKKEKYGIAKGDGAVPEVETAAI